MLVEMKPEITKSQPDPTTIEPKIKVMTEVKDVKDEDEADK